MHSDDLVGTHSCIRKLGEAEGRRIGDEDRIGIANLVELFEHGFLRGEFLIHRFDDKVALGNICQFGGKLQPCQDRLLLAFREGPALDFGVEGFGESLPAKLRGKYRRAR